MNVALQCNVFIVLEVFLLFVILNHRVIYLSYIPHPQHLYKSSDVVLRSRRRCVILGESKLQFI